METQRCPGTRDLLPEDMARFRHIEGVFRDVALSYGYQEVRTPTLEYLYLFTSAGTLTPARLGRVYSFLDWDGWSGERVVLRPDATIPAARLYIENLAQRGLAKLFYVENVFALQAGAEERRESWQCGAEILGSALPAADAELILLALEVLERLGVGPVSLRLSHAGLIKTFLAELGLEASEQAEVFDSLLDGQSQVLGQIQGRTPPLEQPLHLLFDLKGESAAFVENVKALLPPGSGRLALALDNLAAVARLLSAAGCSYQIDIPSARGFEYYTGTVFQLFAAGRKVGGGGRYDELIPLLEGPAVPAGGFALYSDELMPLLPPERVPLHGGEGVLLAPEKGTEAEMARCFEVAGLLRQAGYVATLAFEALNRAGFRWQLSVTIEEGSARYALHDQSSGEEVALSSPSEVLPLLEGLR